MILVQDFINDTTEDLVKLYYAMPTDPLICLKTLSVKYRNGAPEVATVKELS
jgi:hypothetical protein